MRAHRSSAPTADVAFATRLLRSHDNALADGMSGVITGRDHGSDSCSARRPVGAGRSPFGGAERARLDADQHVCFCERRPRKLDATEAEPGCGGAGRPGFSIIPGRSIRWQNMA